MNYLIQAYHLLGLPDDIAQLIINLPFIHSRRGRQRLPNGQYIPKHFYIRILCNAYSYPLFQRLWEDGFFDFYCTNSGFGVYLHQIVIFYCKGGWQSYHYLGCTAPMGDQECHHINGNTLDNRPCNLVMLSSYDHQIVTKHQRGVSRNRIARHTFNPNTDSHTVFNRQGRLIQNHEHFLANIIAQTLYHTNQWITGAHGYLMGTVNWISRFVDRLRLGLDTSVLPNPTWVRFTLSDASSPPPTSIM